MLLACASCCYTALSLWRLLRSRSPRLQSAQKIAVYENWMDVSASYLPGIYSANGFAEESSVAILSAFANAVKPGYSCSPLGTQSNSWVTVALSSPVTETSQVSVAHSVSDTIGFAFAPSTTVEVYRDVFLVVQSADRVMLGPLEELVKGVFEASAHGFSAVDWAGLAVVKVTV